MAIRDRNTLKTYFETGDKPSQDQFADLIDSLKHQDDTFSLSGKEIILIANGLVNITTPYIAYYSGNAHELVVRLEITQQDPEHQIIEIRDTGGRKLKQFFLGNAPYTVTLKTLENEQLDLNEYYSIYFALEDNYIIQKIVGSNLPIPTGGLDLGESTSKRCYFQLSKENYGQVLNLIHTTVTFINNTNVPIEYRATGTFWGDVYTTENSVTNHYDAWDYLTFFCNADMTNETQSIQYNVYDGDTSSLLATVEFTAGQNYENTWGGDVSEIRNIRIECTTL